MEEIAYVPRSLKDVFADFRMRRSTIVRALTTDVEKFFNDCDPEKENLCLHGLPNDTWDVNLPAEEVPPELPEPTLGINFARDEMDRRDWLDLVAVHSDSWLYAVAYYFAARFGFDRHDRYALFEMINKLPTISEVVSGTIVKNPKQRKTSNSSNKSNNMPSSKTAKYTRIKQGRYEEDDDYEALCGKCGESEIDDEFSIFCNVCEKWFHGTCVRIAESIKKYECPACIKRTRILLSGNFIFKILNMLS